MILDPTPLLASSNLQVAKTTLRRVDDVDVGRFNNGDVYLVMHAAEELSATDSSNAARGVTRTLFYWVGSKASMDKGTVACIKAVELRRALPGPCSIRREDEGQESPEFLVLFDTVTVAEEESGARVLSKVGCFGPGEEIRWMQAAQWLW